MSFVKTVFFSFLILPCALSIAACGKNAPPDGGSSKEKARPPETVVAPKHTGTSSAAPVATAEAHSQAPTYHGELIFGGEAKPWGEKGTVAFTVQQDAIRGHAEVSGATLRIRGVVTDGAIRAWFGSDMASMEAPRGGYLYGKLADTSASGAFSIHSIRGETASSGEWTAKKGALP